MEKLIEPLMESAPLAHALSARQCAPGAQDGDSCAWYHGIWQYLRLAGLVAAPDRHELFFHEAFSIAMSENPDLRLLVSGTADYAMLAHVIRAAQTAKKTPTITVLDRCQTPLSLCSWYADRFGIEIETMASDLLEYKPELPFDLICSHSFLPQFSPQIRRLIVSHWRTMLAVGGRIVTNMSFHPDVPEGLYKIDPQDIDRFCRIVQQTSLSSSTAVDVKLLSEQALIYCAQQATYSIRTQEEVVSLFEDAGFSIEELTLVQIDAKGTDVVAGPGANRSSRYLEIVAVHSKD